MNHTIFDYDLYHFPIIIGAYSKRQGRAAAAIIPGGAAPIDREQAAPPYPLHRLSLGIGITSCSTFTADITTAA
jgi:hypothetical protein